MSIKTGRQLAEEGAQLALMAQDEREIGWSEDAREYALEFIEAQGVRPFTGEEIRAYAEMKGLPVAPEPRAWGGILKGLAAKNQIVPVGYRVSKNDRAHARPVRTWMNARKAW